MRLVVCAFVCGILAAGHCVGQTPIGKAKVKPNVPAIPQAARIVVTLNVAKHWTGPEADSLRAISEAHPIVPTWWLPECERSTGLKVEEVRYASAILLPDQHWIGIVGTMKPVDFDAVRNVALPEAKAAQANGQEYFADQVKSLEAMRFSNWRLLGGGSGGIEAYLSLIASTSDQKRTERQIAIVKADTILDVEIQIGLSAEAKAAVPPPLLPLPEATGWHLSLEPADSSLTLLVEATFANEQAASAAQPAMNQAAAIVKQYLQMSAVKMPEFFEQQKSRFPKSPIAAQKLTAAIEAAEAGLEKGKAETSGNMCRLTVKMETPEPVTSAIVLASLLPRAKLKPGEQNPNSPTDR